MVVFYSDDLSCDVQLLLLFLNLVLGTVADANDTCTSFLFLPPLHLIHLKFHHLMTHILERRLSDDPLCHHHICSRFLQVDQFPQVNQSQRQM